jgi:amino acid permease
LKQIPLESFQRIFQAGDSKRAETRQLPSSGRWLGAVALVSASAVGAGLVAMPVRTVSAGFGPAAVALVGCWAYMVLTSLLLVRCPHTAYVVVV